MERNLYKFSSRKRFCTFGLAYPHSCIIPFNSSYVPTSFACMIICHAHQASTQPEVTLLSQLVPAHVRIHPFLPLEVAEHAQWKEYGCSRSCLADFIGTCMMSIIDDHINNYQMILIIDIVSFSPVGGGSWLKE
jgi:hypothetical protein